MKKLKMYAVIGSICMLFCFAECEKTPGGFKRIAVYNNTNYNIDALLSYGVPLFPDTLLADGRFYDKSGYFKPGLARYFGKITTTYKDFIQSYGSDTIIIFIFNADTLSKYTWDEVRADYKILKRYDISWQEMEATKGKIYYPPTEAMKDIKQWPPYGSD